MNQLILEGSSYIPTCKARIAVLQYTIFIALLLLISGCQDKDALVNTAIHETREACISAVSSGSDDKWGINNIEYSLGDEWQYEGENIEVLYNKSFFFLLQKDVTFYYKPDRNFKKLIRTVYSCSGVPPHLTTLKRTYFSAEELNGKIQVEKTEVLVGGELATAPIKEDEFFDVMRRQENRKQDGK